MGIELSYRTVIWDWAAIEITTEEIDKKIRAYIIRPDKFRSIQISPISPSSVNRLESLFKKLKAQGRKVTGGTRTGNNFRCSIVLAEEKIIDRDGE